MAPAIDTAAAAATAITAAPLESASLPGLRIAESTIISIKSIFQSLDGTENDQNKLKKALQEINNSFGFDTDAEDPTALAFLGQMLFEDGLREYAEKSLTAAIEKENGDDQLIQVLTQALLAQDQQKSDSKKAFYESAKLFGYRKYLLLSQCCAVGGFKSLSLFEQALGTITTVLDGLDDLCSSGAINSLQNLSNSKKLVANLRRQLIQDACSTHCCICELYMTDLCMELDAERMCEEHIAAALHLDSSNTEALVTSASVKISQQRPEDAKILLGRAVDPIISIGTDLTSQKLESLPPFSMRINTAKLCIELEMYSEALKLLNQLTLEDEELPDIWYYKGLAYMMRGNGAANVKDLARADEDLSLAKEFIEKLQWEDSEMAQDIGELQKQLDENEALQEYYKTIDKDRSTEEDTNDNEAGLS